MGDIIDAILGNGKTARIHNCVRDDDDPRKVHCKVRINQKAGVTRNGEVEFFGDLPLSKSGELTDDDFKGLQKFVKEGGFSRVLPAMMKQDEGEEE